MSPATWRAAVVLVALAAALSVRAVPARTDEVVRPGSPPSAAPKRKAPSSPVGQRDPEGLQRLSPAHLLGYLYVNNNGTSNSVRAFRFLSDGRLESLSGSPYPTFSRGSGSQVTFPSSRRLLARRGDILYASNTPGGSISGFTIHADGSLSHLAGSPYALTEPATNAVEGLAVHPTEPLLFAADYTGLIRTLAVTDTGALFPAGVPPVSIDDRPEGLAVSPDGSVLAVSYGVSVGIVRTYRIGPSGQLEDVAGSPLELTGSQFGGSLVFSADGSRLFVSSMSSTLGRIHRFAVLRGGGLEEEQGSPFPLQELPFPEGIALSQDGSVLYANDPFTRGIASLSVGADGSISSLGTFAPAEDTGQPSGLAPTPDGSFVLTTNFSHRSVSVLRVNPDGNLSSLHPPVLEGDDDGLIDGGILFVSADPDRDGLSLEVDNCPKEPNNLQEDRDGDGVGDVCDVCVARFDPAQLDADGDGLGDACDPDADADGLGLESDNCPTVPNAGRADADGDGLGDACDNCPDDVNASQEDTDADGVGETCADRAEGFLYVNTNGGHNSVASFLVRSNGRLEPLPGSPFLTDGSGSIGSSQRLAFPGVALALGGRFLYATNADSRSVAGFTVLADGTLRPARGSPYNIGALGPASMAVNDGARMLYIGFAQALGLQSMRIEPDGSLKPSPGFISTPGLPAAMALSPDGKYLVVSMSRVLFHEVHAMPLDSDGVPRPANAPPFVLPVSSFPSGVAFDRSGRVYVADENRIHVLRLDETGRLVSSPGSPFPSRASGGTSLAFSQGFDLLFHTDPEGNGVSSLKAGQEGELPFAHLVASSPVPNVPQGEEPVGIGVDASGLRLFVSNLKADLISIFNVDRDGNLHRNRFSPVPTGASGGQARGPMAFLPIDPDRDGIPFGTDNCPFDTGASQRDADGDGSGDACDTCPGTPNPGNFDTDGDGLGDDCDPERDGDGIPNAEDVCPDDPVPDQTDTDGDGVGNRCDPCLFDPARDTDGDLRCGAADNCPGAYNPAGEDLDGDGIGDPCDTDADADGITGSEDTCPLEADPVQEDRDGDGAGDLCDNCPFRGNAAQIDSNGDGVGDDCADLPAGVVYINNDSFHDNTVSGFLMSYAGGLRPLPGSPFSTGAPSSFRDSAMPRLAIDRDRRLLFALNGGAAPSVAVLKIVSDGSLEPVDGSPFPLGSCGMPLGLALAEGDSILVVPTSGRCLMGLSVLPDGRLDSRESFRVELARTPVGMAVHPEGHLVALTYPDISSVAAYLVGDTVLQAPGSPFRVNPGSDFGVWSAAFDPDGGHLLVGSARRAPPSAVYIFEVRQDGSLEELHFSPSQGRGIGPTIVAITADRRFVIGANAGTNDLDLYEFVASGFPATRGITSNFFGGSRIAAGLALNGDGSRAVVTNSMTADAGVFLIGRGATIRRLGQRATPTGDPLAAPTTGVVLFEGDLDHDGLDFGPDNCPLRSNPGQDDGDGDGLGDACDNCPADFNVDQLDLDADGSGDTCDPDDDGDGVADGLDLCPALRVHGRGDQDRDGLGDACDPDRDGDLFPDDADLCPAVPDPDQEDLDRDGVGDACEGSLAGVLYVSTNAPENSVAGFTFTRGGSLRPLSGSPFSTGGFGQTEELERRLPDLALSGSFVVAANLGSGDISALRIEPDGTLSLAPGSPIQVSGGLASGLATDAARGRVFAVGQDTTVLDLLSLMPDGRLEREHAIPLAGRARGIAFEAGRSVLAVSLTSNRIATFITDAQGDLAGAPGSPFAGDSGGSAGPLTFAASGALLLAGNRGTTLGTITLRSVTTTGSLSGTVPPLASQAVGVSWLAGRDAAPGRFRLMVLPEDGDVMRFIELTNSGQQVFSRSFQGRSAAAGPSSGLFSRDGGLLMVANGADNVSSFRVDVTGRPRVLEPAPAPTGEATARPEGGILMVDGDVDGDGLDFSTDNCPLALNPDQEDRDGDGVGDLCDDRHPPEAVAGEDREIECGSFPASGGGTLVTLDGRGSRDPDGAGSGGIVSHDWFLDLGGPGELFLGSGELLKVALPRGRHRVTLRVKDSDGQAATDAALIVVEDTLPPTLTGSIAPQILFPPNHKLVEVRADLFAQDQCEPTLAWRLESASSDEPDDLPGGSDGATGNDIQGAQLGTQDASVMLRAERDALGAGRTYTLTFMAQDSMGHQIRRSLMVRVPRSAPPGAAPGLGR